MKVAKSTLKALLRDRTGQSTLTHEEVMARNARQETFNLLAGHGCGDCCGRSPLFDGQFRCPLFEPGVKLPKEVLERAVKCGIPGLWKDVAGGKRQSVTPEEIIKACPFLGEEG